ncbi:MAG: hypothetical protein KBT36_09245 [Kurthia sp.]|nr:hypothetical protein [Candidatus Kurthia equi]
MSNLDISNFVTATEGQELTSPEVSPTVKLEPTFATNHPYDSDTIPRDILHYLPPSGAPFSLFGDPFAQQYYLMPDINVIRNCQYWLRGKMEDNNFTKHEIALFTFLLRHRVATRQQIHKVIFDANTSEYKVKEFLRKCVKNGVLVSFKWVSPCKGERKVPHLYGLSPVAAKGAIDLLNRSVYLPRNYQFIPTQFVPGQAPSMTNYFSTVIANEFYTKLYDLDRIIDWSNNESYTLLNGFEFRPQYVIKTIKDANDFKYLWLEIIRPQQNWYNHTINRFRNIEAAITTLSREVRPEIVVLLVDDVSRIPDISALAEHFMPSVPIRFTTDERLIQKESDAIFYMYSDNGIVPARITHLTADYPGMTASEYHASFYDQAEDDDDDDNY